jgi:ubiquinone/menaquinone biosynthesis C-methylase UbiE
MVEQATDKPHSADYLLTDWRDFWWNADFMSLMAKRWQLSQVQTVLDVGCGRGHWLATLLPHLNDDVSCIGIDKEPSWIEEVSQTFAKRYKPRANKQVRFIEGDIYELPFADNSLDLVTCQTVLIHIPDVKAGIAEMLRVTKPGGLMVFSEPENLRNACELNSLTLDMPIEKHLACVEFRMRWERGKTALGEGNVSIGSLVPGYLSEFPVTDMQTYQSDQTISLYPPYSRPEQQALVKDAHDHYRQKTGLWDMERSKRYVLAGGASEEHFAKLWQIMKEMEEESLALMDEKRMSFGGASAQYLISARKAD